MIDAGKCGIIDPTSWQTMRGVFVTRQRLTDIHITAYPTGEIDSPQRPRFQGVKVNPAVCQDTDEPLPLETGFLL